MILIGQYDSPFVRRVGITLTLYGLPFEHRPWSAFSDAFRIRPLNPLVRVPTLVLDDGEALVESHYILDYLDGLASDDRVLLPRKEPARHRALKIVALSTGLGDKAVNLYYEQQMHKKTASIYVERLRAQILGTLDALEQSRAALDTPYWTGARISQADISASVMWHFIETVHPGLIEPDDFPALSVMSRHFEALPAFQQIRQAFIPPT